MMTHTPVRLRRVWTQEVDTGVFLVKGFTASTGKTLYLRRVYNGAYDFIEDKELATTYVESTSEKHARTISLAINRGKCITYLLTDNRVNANLLFVVLINGRIFGGVFDRAERAEQAVDLYNSTHDNDRASYIEVTDSLNQLYNTREETEDDEDLC